VTQAANTLTTSENRKLAVLMRMALTYADAAGAEPDASKHRTSRPVHDVLAASAVASPLAGYCGSGVSGEAWRPEMQPGRLSDGRHKPAPARSRRAAPSFRLGRGSFHGIIQKRAPRKLDFD
jgi:hypothetical protein